MTTCDAYRVGIPKDSPVFGLYEGLRSAGVQDEHIDRAGDCYISPEDVVDTAVADWKKYQGLLESNLGFAFPWSLDDLDPKTTFDADIRKKIDAAAVIIKDILIKKGFQEGTDEFKKRAAVAMVAFACMPSTQDYRNISSEGRDEIAKQISVLDGLDMAEYKSVLMRDGGLGALLGNKDAPVRISALKALERGVRRYEILYAVLEAAGMEPVAMEMPSSRAIEFSTERLGASGVVTNVRVGIRLSDSVIAFNALEKRGEMFLAADGARTLEARQHLQYYMARDPDINPDRVRALGNDSMSSSARWELAGLEYKKGDIRGAIATLEEVIANDPQCVMVYYKLAALAVEAGLYEDARRYMQTLLKMQDLTDIDRGMIWTHIAASDMQEDKPDEAIEYLLKAKELKLADPQIIDTGLAMIYLRKGEYEKAKLHSKLILEKAPYSWEAHLMLGMASMMHGDLDEALVSLQKAAASGRAVTASFIMALVYHRQKRFDEMQNALFEFDSSASRKIGILKATSPNELRDFLEEIYQLTNGGDNYKVAPEFKKMASGMLSLSLGSAYAAYAYMVFAKGDPKKAIDILKDGLEWEPENPTIHSLLSELYEAGGDVPKARDAWESFLKFRDAKKAGN